MDLLANVIVSILEADYSRLVKSEQLEKKKIIGIFSNKSTNLLEYKYSTR
jgi:hypothetical protein